MRADRLLRLVVLLQRHGRVPAATLAEWLEVSERTVLRDMEALSAAGVPAYTERGRHGGCVLLEGFTTDASGLTATEAQALFAWTARESVAELGLGAELTGALAKVAATASAPAVDRAEALGSVLVSDRRRWFGEAERVAHLPALREAAVAGRRVRLQYLSPGRTAPGRRTVDPLGLVDHSGRWYLVATHRGRHRTYRVSRIAGLEVLADPVAPSDGRSLAEVWAELRGAFEAKAPDPLVMDVLVRPAVAREFLLVSRSQLVTGAEPTLLRETADGAVWRLEIRAHRAGLALALAWAPDVRVLAPAPLIDELQAAAEVVRQTYAELGHRTGPASPVQ